MKLELSKRRYIIYGSLFLLVASCVALLQNFIRYGAYEGYDLIDSIVYLIVTLLGFTLLLPLIYRCINFGVGKYRKYYTIYVLVLSTISVCMYYVLASVTIHFLGFYDSFFSEQYARYYFGREALIHLTMMIVSGFILYVFPFSENGVGKRISAAIGRKEITIFTKDIQWIEAYDHYLKIHTSSDSLLKRSTLEEMTKELKPEFIRIHRKYLVNKAQIVRKEKQHRDEFVILQSGDKLKVGRSFSPLEW